MKTIRYNNELLGDGATLSTFSRAIATKDAYGNTVASGSRRYDRTRGMCELLSSSLELSSVSAGIYANGGEDYDNSPLAIVYESVSGRVRIFRNGWSNAIHDKIYMAGLGGTFDLMDGSVSGLRFQSYAFVICKGLILAGCRRVDTSSGDTVGVALLQSTDYGTSWSIVTNTDGDQSQPDIDVGQSRVTTFSLQNWMPCVIDGEVVAYGGVFADYIYQPAMNGGQCTLWLATANEYGAPVMKHVRLGSTLPAVQHHFHTGGVQFLQLANGKIRCAYVVAIGDSIARNRVELMWIDCEPDFSDWETATININHEFHGSADYLIGGNREGYQFSSCCVGPEENTLLVASDFDSGYIHKLTFPGESEDWSTAKARFNRVGPYTESYGSSAGNGGIENFAIQCKDPINRTDFVTVWNHKVLTTPVFVGAYSRDGNTWSECFQPLGSSTPTVFWFNDTICQPAGSLGIYSWTKPVDWVSCRPLMLGHGVDNKVDVSSQWVAPDAGTTCEVMTANPDGSYTIPSGPNAGETIMPLGDTEVFHITATTGLRPFARYLNPSAVMDTEITTGCVVIAVLPIGGESAVVDVDVSSTTALSCFSSSIGRWKVFTLSGNVYNTLERPRMMLRCRYGATQAAQDCMVQVLTLHQDVNGGIGYPPLAHPNADDTIHELEQIEDITVGSRWSTWMGAMVPEIGWKAYPYPLLTIVDENDDWVKVAWTADKTVTLTTSISDVETSASISTLYLFRWARETQLRLSVSKTGSSETTLQISCGGQTIAETSVAAAISGTTLSLNLAANEDQTVVAPLTVFGVRVWSPEDVIISPTGPMLSEDDPDVDALETAAASAQLTSDQAAVASAKDQFTGTILSQEGDLGLVVMSDVATATNLAAAKEVIDEINARLTT